MPTENKEKHLTLKERRIIRTGIENGSTKTAIAETIGKDNSTIGKEIKLHRVLQPRFHCGTYFGNLQICMRIRNTFVIIRPKNRLATGTGFPLCAGHGTHNKTACSQAGCFCWRSSVEDYSAASPLRNAEFSIEFFSEYRIRCGIESVFNSPKFFQLDNQ